MTTNRNGVDPEDCGSDMDYDGGTFRAFCARRLNELRKELMIEAVRRADALAGDDEASTVALHDGTVLVATSFLSIGSQTMAGYLGPKNAAAALYSAADQTATEKDTRHPLHRALVTVANTKSIAARLARKKARGR